MSGGSKKKTRATVEETAKEDSTAAKIAEANPDASKLAENVTMDAIQANILAALKNIQDDIKREFNDKIDTLKTEVSGFRVEIVGRLEGLNADLNGVTQRVEEAEQRVADMEEFSADVKDALEHTLQLQLELQTRLTDIESRARRNNIRVHGIVEELNYECSMVEPSPLSSPTSSGVRLQGGWSRCDGVLELRHKGKMTRLLPFNEERHWDDGPRFTVCRNLDCGTAVFAEYTDGFDSRALDLSVECVKRNNNIKDCAGNELQSTSWGFRVVCSGLLERPTLTLSVTVGVSQIEARSLRVLLGSQFLVQCSVKPQFSGGSFQLLSPTGNQTLPAVNHSTHFLFNHTGPAHKGDYTCVYHQQVFNHSFSSESEGLELRLGVRDSDFIIRVVVLLLLKIVCIPMIYCYCKAKARGGARERTTPI
uniref:SRCR domain-containing protein n=1 Tax=Knipowitschia caucasica TaxID=637954 RepID=A0AAV2KR66_KNICA